MQSAVVHPKGFGGGGPTAEAMMNMNLLLGMSAFNHTQDLCEMLEIVAPNVSELQLFGDDVPEVCMSRKCLFIFPLFRRFNSVLHHSIRGVYFSLIRLFTFRCLSHPRPSRFHSSLLVPRTWRYWEWVVCLLLSGWMRLSLFGPLVSRPRPPDSTYPRFHFAHAVLR